MKVKHRSLWLRGQAIVALCLSIIVVAFVGCGGGGEGLVTVTEIILSAILTGSQEVPPVQTDAGGNATVKINAARTQIVVELNTTGLQNVTAAHIHKGAVGENGPVIFTLYRQVDGPFPATLRKTLTEVDQGSPLSFAEAVDAILSGNTYINVHTPSHPAGEIRGQIVRSISFSKEIQPIFNRSCAVAGCHDSASQRGGLNLSAGVARGNLVNVRSAQNPNFIRVLPGKPEQSLLYLKISQPNPPVGAQMPPGQNPLPLEERLKIWAWIIQGALDN